VLNASDRELLDRRQVNFTIDHDTILVTGMERRSARLLILARDHAPERFNVRLTFKNGGD